MSGRPPSTTTKRPTSWVAMIATHSSRERRSSAGGESVVLMTRSCAGPPAVGRAEGPFDELVGEDAQQLPHPSGDGPARLFGDGQGALGSEVVPQSVEGGGLGRLALRRARGQASQPLPAGLGPTEGVLVVVPRRVPRPVEEQETEGARRPA